MGTNWETLIASWKKLKNNLNWLNKTSGRKLKTLYFWLLTALDILFLGWVYPSNLTNLSTFISGPRQQRQHFFYFFIFPFSIFSYENLWSDSFVDALSLTFSVNTLCYKSIYLNAYFSTHAHCMPNRSDFKVALYFIILEYTYYKLQTYSIITNQIYNTLF